MSKSRRNSNSPEYNKNKKTPEVRDNLDSRKNEEQNIKGGNTTNNRKEHHKKSRGAKSRANNSG